MAPNQPCENTSGRPLNSVFSVLVTKIYSSVLSALVVFSETTEKTSGFKVDHFGVYPIIKQKVSERELSRE